MMGSFAAFTQFLFMIGEESSRTNIKQSTTFCKWIFPPPIPLSNRIFYTPASSRYTRTYVVTDYNHTFTRYFNKYTNTVNSRPPEPNFFEIHYQLTLIKRRRVQRSIGRLAKLNLHKMTKANQVNSYII